MVKVHNLMLVKIYEKRRDRDPRSVVPCVCLRAELLSMFLLTKTWTDPGFDNTFPFEPVSNFRNVLHLSFSACQLNFMTREQTPSGTWKWCYRTRFYGYNIRFDFLYYYGLGLMLSSRFDTPSMYWISLVDFVFSFVL